PLCSIDRLAAPCHLGEQVEGERIIVHSLRKNGGAYHVAVGAAQTLQALGDIADARTQGRAAAEFPDAAEQKRRAAKILLSIVARHAIVIDIDDEQMPAIDAAEQVLARIPLPRE